MSQRARILAHLQKGLTLTPLEALDKFQTMRLAAHVHALRERGHEIQTSEGKTEDGRTFAIYWLPSKSETLF